VFTPVLAKHSKSFSLIDCISVGVDRMQRNSVSEVRARYRQRRSTTPNQNGRKEAKNHRTSYDPDRLPQFWLGSHEQENSKKDGASDAERNL